MTDLITELKPNQIFVFGSNTAGMHGAGAARQAHEQFGAKYGVGEGRTGQCYAFPTLNGRLRKREDYALVVSAMKFKMYAETYPDLEFLLTKVGCGLGGYEEWEMKWLFRNMPPNVVRPQGW